MFSKRTKRPRNFRLSAQTTAINAAGFILTLGLLFFSIYYRYLGEEDQLANTKLLRFWTFTSHLMGIEGREQILDIRALRNEYYKNLNSSNSVYGLRITNEKQEELLFLYPDVWDQQGLGDVDFRSFSSDVSRQVLSVEENGNKRNIDFTLYSIQNQNFNIQVVLSSASRNSFLLSIIRGSLVIAVVVLVASYFASHVIVTRSLGPMYRINRLAEEIIEHQSIDKRLPVDSRGEFVRLQENINKMLDVIERQVDRLRDAAISLGHDIRTPLTRIFNFLEEEANNSKEGERKEKILSCIQSIKNIQFIARQVLDLSEIESGSVRIPTEKVQLAHALEGVVDMYGFAAEEKGVYFESQIMPDVSLYIEETRIKQLVGNLLDNAVKFTPKGRQVKLQVSEKLAQVVLEVSDEGVGIDVEDIDKIWLSSWKKNHESMDTGAGFGLSIVHSIVHAYNGKIQVESERESGTKFTVLFPLTTT